MSDPVEELKRVIASGEAIVVCGAGTTIAATGGTAPGWLELIKRGLACAKALHKVDDAEAWVVACNAFLGSANAANWLKAADEIASQLGAPHGTPWQEFLRVEVGSIKATATEVPQAIAALKVPIATTNYDAILCRAAGLDPATWRAPQHVAGTLSRQMDAIWHLHGHWQDSESVIFSGDDYRRVRADELAQFLQRHVAFDKTLIFVGCSNDGLGDQNIGEMLRWFGSHWLGSGKRHFVLVPDGKEKEAWPSGIEPLAHGKGHGSLAPFLRAIAPQFASSVGRLPPEPNMIGRKKKLAELVKLLLDGKGPIVIPGGPGMGKSTMAIAAAYHPDIAKRWPERLFVPLDAVTEGRGILSVTATALGVPTTGSEAAIETALIARVSMRPVLVILDNAETPLRASEPKERTAGLETYRRLASFPGLALIVTCRDRPIVLNRGYQLRDIERLDDESAKTLFLREAGNDRMAADPDLPALLAELDGHPLSIALVGRGAQGYKTVKPILDAWRARRAHWFPNRTDITRLESTRMSLSLSLAAPDCTEPARRLLSQIAYAPVGLAISDLDAVAPGSGDESGQALINLRLVEVRDGRVTMLAPLRECARIDLPLDRHDEIIVRDFFLRIGSQMNDIGTPRWNSARQTREFDHVNTHFVIKNNIDSKILDEATLKALEGLSKYYWFSGIGSTAIFEDAAAVARIQNNELAEGILLRIVGDISFSRSDNKKAKVMLKKAAAIFSSIGNAKLESFCLRDYANVLMSESLYVDAEAVYRECIKLGETFDSGVLVASCLHNIGRSYLERGDTSVAKKYFTSAYVKSRVCRSIIVRTNTLRSIGEICIVNENWRLAYRCISSCQKSYESIGSKFGEALCYTGFGDIAAGQGDHDLARIHYERAKEIHSYMRNVLCEAHVLRSLALVSIKDARIDYAKDLLARAIDLYSRLPNKMFMGLSYALLSSIEIVQSDREASRGAARAAWSSIKRQDLIDRYLT